MASSQNSKKEVDVGSGVERLSNLIHGSKEIIAISINIITAVLLFSTQDPKTHHYDKFLLYIEILNIITLFAAVMILSKKYNLELDQKSKKELTILLKFANEHNPKHSPGTTEAVTERINRINLVIQQVIKSHRGFAISLIFLYFLLFLYGISQVNEKDTVKNNSEKFEKAKKGSDAVYDKK